MIGSGTLLVPHWPLLVLGLSHLLLFARGVSLMVPEQLFGCLLQLNCQSDGKTGTSFGFFSPNYMGQST